MTVINAETLRTELQSVIRRAQQGERFTVLYRSQPVCEIVPVSASPPPGDLKDDPLYRAPGVGRSRDGRTAKDHDAVQYRSDR